MAFDTNPTIDKEQIRIKEILDKPPNGTDSGRSEQLAQIYIQEIDAFQAQVRGLEDVESNDQMKTWIRDLLEAAIDPESIEALSADLHTQLDSFESDIKEGKTRQKKADALLDSEEALAVADAVHIVEIEGVQLFRNQVAAENSALGKKITQMRAENEGWTGYAHAIEPSNLIASIGGSVNIAFGGEGIKTKQMINLELTESYLRTQTATEIGLSILLKTMKGSESQHKPPMSLKEAWQTLTESQNANFAVFRGSPDGRLFERTTLQNKEPTPNDRAQYLYDKGMAIVTYIGREEAEIYFQGLIQEFPDSPYAEKAKAYAITTGEKAYASFSNLGDTFLRLDMLALMAVMPAAGAVAARSALGLRTANLIAKYPQAAKLVPGVTVLSTRGSAGLGLVTKTTGNLAVEVTKFMAYHQATEAIAGPEAAYAVGALCFFMPGLVHGFEKQVGSKIDQYLAEKGEQGLADLMRYTSEEVGDPRLLREVFVRGLERKALAAGEKPNRALIEKTVDEAIFELESKIGSKIFTPAHTGGFAPLENQQFKEKLKEIRWPQDEIDYRENIAWLEEIVSDAKSFLQHPTPAVDDELHTVFNSGISWLDKPRTVTELLKFIPGILEEAEKNLSILIPALESRIPWAASNSKVLAAGRGLLLDVY